MTQSDPADARPNWHDTSQATAYLRDEARLPVTEKTLANWRTRGIGPAVEYFGTKPLYRKIELERFAREAVRPVPPVLRPGRKRKQPSDEPRAV